MSNRVIAVTGACGFLGSSLLQRLRQEAMTVIPIVHGSIASFDRLRCSGLWTMMYPLTREESSMLQIDLTPTVVALTRLTEVV